MPANNTPPQEPPFLLIGHVLRPHGIRGELRIDILTAYPDRIVAGKRVFLGPDVDKPSTATEYIVARSRRHQHYLILQLEGVTTRNDAELLRAHHVMITVDEAVPLEEGEIYLFQLIGIQVITDEDEALGQVTDVIETGANNVFVVKGPRGEVLLPDIDECVLDIDIDAGTMTVHILDGLLGD